MSLLGNLQLDRKLSSAAQIGDGLSASEAQLRVSTLLQDGWLDIPPGLRDYAPPLGG
jgi:hypothetical protein